MRARVARFAARLARRPWILDLGVGWGWHWEDVGHDIGVIGIDMSLRSLHLARGLLAKRPDIVLVCADAAQLPLRKASIAGVWSIQVFQHLPAEVFERAKAELERVLTDKFVLELCNLNPAWVNRASYRLVGRRLHRTGHGGKLELNRLSGAEWLDRLRDFRPTVTRSTDYSELFFHPELRLRPRPYPLKLEDFVASRMPMLAAATARQVHVRLVEGGVSN